MRRATCDGFARSLTAAVFGGLFFLGAGAAQAQTPTDFATACTGQAPGAQVTIGPFYTGDGSWSVNNGGSVANYYLGSGWYNIATASPAQPAGASWIGMTYTGTTYDNTNFTYTLTAPLAVATSVVNLASIVVTGWYAGDDQMVAILVDGQSTTVPASSPATLNSIAATAPTLGSLFQTGNNTLAFTVHNLTTPTGFYANVSINATCASPNLTTSLTGPGTLNAGVPGTYTLTVTNNGGAASTDGTTTINLPPGLTLDPTSLPSNCTATAGNTGMTCTLAGITANGGSMTIPFNVTAAGAVPVGGDITGSVTGVTGEADTTLTPVPVNAVAPNLVDSLSGPAHVSAGKNNPYTLIVTNNGTGTSNGGTTTVNLPPGLTLVSPLPAGCTANAANTAMTCTLPDIGANGSTTIPFEVTASGAAAGGSITGSIANVPGEADAPAAPLAQADAIAPNLVSTLDGPKNLAVGTPATFTVDVTNTGNAPSTDGTVTIDLPPGLTLDPASLPSYCAATAGNTGMTCNPLPTINPTDSLQIPFTVTASQPVNNGEITGSVTGVTGEPNVTLAAFALQSYVPMPTPMLGPWALALLAMLMVGGGARVAMRGDSARR